MEEIFKEELGRESVFSDASKLSPDYVPQVLVHREEEFRQLTRFFKPVLDTRASQRVLITGGVGVGKTALAMRFGRELEPEAKKRGMKLRYVHVNCRKQRTPHAVLQEAVSHLPHLRLPPRGFSSGELLREVVRYLNAHDEYLTLTLDEFDFFVRINGPDLLYALTRPAEELGAPNRISLISIARDENFLRSLDVATQSTFLHNLIRLDRYGAAQLVDILRNRIKEALRPGAVEDDSVELIADIASRWGDARFALELLWRAGMIADGQGTGVVVPEHVRMAKAEVYPEVRKEVLLELHPHERLVLLAAARRLRASKLAYVMTGEVEQAYHLVCEEYRESPRAHTQFWECFQRLDALGLVDLQPSGKEHRGRSLRISVPDVPVAMLEGELKKLLRKRKKA